MKGRRGAHSLWASKFQTPTVWIQKSLISSSPAHHHCSPSSSPLSKSVILVFLAHGSDFARLLFHGLFSLFFCFFFGIKNWFLALPVIDFRVLFDEFDWMVGVGVVRVTSGGAVNPEWDWRRPAIQSAATILSWLFSLEVKLLFWLLKFIKKESKLLCGFFFFAFSYLV